MINRYRAARRRIVRGHRRGDIALLGQASMLDCPFARLESSSLSRHFNVMALQQWD